MQIASRLDKINQDKMVLLKQRGRFVLVCFAVAEVSFVCLFSFVCLVSLLFLFRLDALCLFGCGGGDFCLKVSRGFFSFEVRVGMLCRLALGSLSVRKEKWFILTGIFGILGSFCYFFAGSFVGAGCCVKSIFVFSDR